jgi:hypothetical protein
MLNWSFVPNSQKFFKKNEGEENGSICLVIRAE